MSTKITINTLDPRRIAPVVTPKQFVALTGYSLSAVYRWIKEGEIKASKIGPKLWRIPKSELLRALGMEDVPA